MSTFLLLLSSVVTGTLLTFIFFISSLLIPSLCSLPQVICNFLISVVCNSLSSLKPSTRYHNFVHNFYAHFLSASVTQFCYMKVLPLFYKAENIHMIQKLCHLFTISVPCSSVLLSLSIQFLQILMR